MERTLHTFIGIPITLALLTGLVTGCGKTPAPPDEQVTQIAKQSLETQAKQNDRLADQTHEVVETSKELVKADASARKELITADAEARKEIVSLQRDLQTDQHEIGKQRDVLEVERKDIDKIRYREQLVSAAISTAGLLLVAGLPLLVAIYMLRAVRHTEIIDAAVTEILVDELISERPRLLDRPMPIMVAGPPNCSGIQTEEDENP